jgi:hypothetical protein
MTPSNDCPPADLRDVAWPGRWLFLMENDSFSSRAVELQNELAAMQWLQQLAFPLSQR